ncbi:MAG: helix-turn-helix domain-containing protein [Planctomycetes bacterium]|nr:helix-turn-helix domain-containing protein [Planctomycetota bacterium]
MRTHPEPPDDTATDYVARVNRAIDHVVTNLAGDVSLAAVAQAAHFSPFHFHRVWKSLLGETLGQFVKRQRLERALHLMSHDRARTLTDVAFACGFASSSDFSRSFKQRFGVAPRAFDLDAFRKSRRAEFERAHAAADGTPRFTTLPAGANPDGFAVTLRDLPPRTVAYVRVLDPFRSLEVVADAYEHLRQWAEPRGYADRQWLGYMWDEPEIVAMADCRYDAALVVDDVRPSGRIGRLEFPAMRVAEVRIAGDIALEVRALDWLYGTWLPRSGYVPDDQPAFEAWLGRPFAHGVEHFTIACQLPVRRDRR